MDLGVPADKGSWVVARVLREGKQSLTWPALRQNGATAAALHALWLRTVLPHVTSSRGRCLEGLKPLPPCLSPAVAKSSWAVGRGIGTPFGIRATRSVSTHSLLKGWVRPDRAALRPGRNWVGAVLSGSSPQEGTNPLPHPLADLTNTLVDITKTGLMGKVPKRSSELTTLGIDFRVGLPAPGLRGVVLSKELLQRLVGSNPKVTHTCPFRGGPNQLPQVSIADGAAPWLIKELDGRLAVASVINNAFRVGKQSPQGVHLTAETRLGPRDGTLKRSNTTEAAIDKLESTNGPSNSLRARVPTGPTTCIGSKNEVSA